MRLFPTAVPKHFWCVPLLLGALGACLLAPSVAQASARVVLVTNHEDAHIVPLLVAELTRLGIEVLQVDHGEDEVLPRDLGRAARRTESIAGIRVLVARGTVEVWIADRVTGKVVLREVLVQEGATHSGETTVVLRAIELLRVSLMELEAPHESHGEIEPPEGLENLIGFPESRGVFAVDLGLGVLWVAPELDPMLTAHLGAAYRVHPNLYVGLAGTLGLSAASLNEPEGTASVSTRLFVATLRYSFSGPTDFVQGGLGIGGGLSWTTVNGDAAAPLLEFEEHSFNGVIVVEGRIGLRLISQVHLWLGATGIVLPRVPAVEFVGRRVATFSPVNVEGSFGVRLALP